MFFTVEHNIFITISQPVHHQYLVLHPKGEVEYRVFLEHHRRMVEWF
jgi:hypothetical protein